VPFPYGADDAASFVNLVHESDGETHAWLLVPRDNPGVRIVGGCGLHDVVGNEAEFGYWIATDEWGKGYATEAARELLRHAFGTLRFERIEGAYFRSNPASRRVMEKVGLTPMPEGSYDGVIVCRDGREEPAWRVAITRGAWLASS
jgi:[ribosomal protein S5]-alanine N-acetyltransferase